jgi:hypothetical protein
MAATYIGTQNRTDRIQFGISSRVYERLIEGFWCTLCLALFIVLGPFAAPIALAFMFSNHVLDSEMQEPECHEEHV